jgi:hypothetical protein
LESLRVRKPLGRLRHRWEDDIKVYLKEIRMEGVDWIGLSKDRAGCELL